jgi:hypothetical protein
MSNGGLDELGPIDYLVVEFPAGKSNFSGEMGAHLTSLVDRGLVRVLDLLFISKMADGSIEAFEANEVEDDDLGVLRELGAEAAQLLAEEDVDAIAAVIEPGSIAAVLVWENTWAAPFGSSIRRSGGQLVATGRIPVQGILAALEADAAETQAEGV